MENQEIKKEETVVNEEPKVEEKKATPELPSENKEEPSFAAAPTNELPKEEANASAEVKKEESTVPENTPKEETPAPVTDQTPVEQPQTIDASNQPIAMMAAESTAQQQEPKKEEEAKPQEEAIPKVKELTAEEKKKSHESSFNSDERLLYEIKPDKQGNPLVVLFFFLAIFAFIVFLPTISKKYENIFGKTFVNNTPTPVTPAQPTTPEEAKKTDFYKLNGGNFRAAIGDLEMINFVRSEKNGEKFLSFTVQNIADKVYQYNNKYYVSIYKDETLLYRALIHTYEPLPAKGADEISLIISDKAYKEGNQFKLEEINPSQYPTAKINETSGEYQVLTCSYRYDEMKYFFIDNKLSKIEEKYIQASNTPNYANDKTNIQNLTDKLKITEGIESTFLERDSEFEMVNSFELKDTSDSNLASLQIYRFFKYNESKDIVKFEIEAQGYKCS